MKKNISADFAILGVRLLNSDNITPIPVVIAPKLKTGIRNRFIKSSNPEWISGKRSGVHRPCLIHTHSQGRHQIFLGHLQDRLYTHTHTHTEPVILHTISIGYKTVLTTSTAAD